MAGWVSIFVKKLYLKSAGLMLIGYLMTVSVASRAQSVQANGKGGDKYSASQEYKNMIDELHAPAPSPAYIATGERPTADAHLRVAVHHNQQTLRLETALTEFTFDKQSYELRISNRTTHAEWRASFSGSGSPAKPQVAISRKANRWVLPTAAHVPCAPLTLEIMTEELTRLTCGALRDRPFQSSFTFRAACRSSVSGNVLAGRAVRDKS